MQVDAEDILEISAHFGTLEDPRCHINRKHLLGDLIWPQARIFCAESFQFAGRRRRPSEYASHGVR